MEKYTDIEITHCTQCPKYCPIGSVQCGRGQKLAESLQRKGCGEKEENNPPEDCEDKFSKDSAQESGAQEQYGWESHGSGPYGQELHSREPHGQEPHGREPHDWESRGQKQYGSGPHGQESHDWNSHDCGRRAQEYHDRGIGENSFGSRGRQRTENFRSGGDSRFHGRPEDFSGVHGEDFSGAHGEDFSGVHGEDFRGAHGEDFREVHGEDFRGAHGGGFRGAHGDGFRGAHGDGFREAREDFRRGWHRQGMELEPEDELSALMRTCVYHLFQRGGRKNGQERILHILSHREELSQRELQEILRIQPGSISEILSKMERAGLLTRERDNTDKRRIVLKLTDAGRKMADDGGEQKRDFFAPLDEEQKEQLKGLLKILLDAWSENEK